MKILSIDTPKVLDYYVAEKYKEQLVNKCIKGYCEFPDGTSHLLYTVIDYNPDVFAVLKLYTSKVSKLTRGEKYLYEYELDVSETEGDKDFTIKTEDGQTYIGQIDSIHMDGESTIIIIFKIR